MRLSEIASPDRLASDTFAEKFRGLGQGESWQGENWQEMQLVNKRCEQPDAAISNPQGSGRGDGPACHIYNPIRRQNLPAFRVVVNALRH